MQIMSCRRIGLIAAVEGYERTGIPLVSGEYGHIGCSDDIGSYYFIPKLVHVFGLEIDTAISLFYTGMVILSFMAAAVAICRYCKTNLGKAISLFALALLSLVSIKLGDVYVALGATPMALVPWWLYVHQRGSIKICLFYCALAGLIIAVAHFIRAHAGTGVLVFVTTSLLFTKRYSWKHKAAFCTTLVAGMLAVFMYFGHLVQQRDAYYLATLERTYQPPLKRHPFWHAVYLGFGFLNNDHGIIFKDANAMTKVVSIDPNARHGSPKYEAILKSQVFRLVRSDPHFVLRTVFAKLGVCLMYVLIFANVGLLLSVIYPKGWPLEFAFLASIAFNALFGILVMPRPSYLLGLMSFSTIYGMLSIDFALHCGFLRRLRAGKKIAAISTKEAL